MKSLSLLIWLGLCIALTANAAEDKQPKEEVAAGMKKEEAPPPAEDANDGEESSESADEGDTEHQLPKYFHLEMDPLIISHIHPRRRVITHFIVMSYGIEVADQESLDKLTTWKMRLHDQVLLNVIKYLTLFWQGKGEINKRQIKMLLKKIIGQVVPGEKIKKIIINSLRVDKAS